MCDVFVPVCSLYLSTPYYICMMRTWWRHRTQGGTFARNKKEKKEAAARMPDIIRKVVRPALLAVSLILKARE